MAKLFSKLSQAPKMFSKAYNDPNLFRKMSNTARKADHTIQRVGNFIANSGKEVLGVMSGVQGGSDAVHNIRKHFQNALPQIEKKIKAQPQGGINFV
jgi:hypothetical protein